ALGECSGAGTSVHIPLADDGGAHLRAHAERYAMTDATEGYARVGGRVGETLPSRSCSRRWTDRRRDWALSRRRVPAKRVVPAPSLCREPELEANHRKATKEGTQHHELVH